MFSTIQPIGSRPVSAAEQRGLAGHLDRHAEDEPGNADADQQRQAGRDVGFQMENEHTN